MYYYSRPGNFETSETTSKAPVVGASAYSPQEIDEAIKIIISVGKQAFELSPRGANPTVFMDFLKAKVGEEQYHSFVDMFAWKDTEVRPMKFQEWLIQHFQGLRIRRSGIIYTKRRWQGTNEELLRKVIQLHLTINPTLPVKSLLKKVRTEAINALDGVYLQTRFQAWLECTLSELGWKVRQ